MNSFTEVQKKSVIKLIFSIASMKQGIWKCKAAKRWVQETERSSRAKHSKNHLYRLNWVLSFKCKKTHTHTKIEAHEKCTRLHLMKNALVTEFNLEIWVIRAIMSKWNSLQIVFQTLLNTIGHKLFANYIGASGWNALYSMQTN